MDAQVLQGYWGERDQSHQEVLVDMSQSGVYIVYVYAYDW
jgi:hypothetical protein